MPNDTNSAYKDYPCDICGSGDAIEVPHARMYTANQAVHICRECGFVYVRARRDSAAIADAWSEEIFGGVYTARIPAMKARQVYVADFVDVTLGLKGKDVLDIGTGEGQFLEIVRREYAARVFGIEPSKQNCDTLARLGIDHFVGTIEQFTASAAARGYAADIATIKWTLENCESCEQMLRGAHGALRDAGHIVVATGSRILVPFKKPLGRYLSKNPADSHCFRFSANALQSILAKTGFELVHVNQYIDSDILCMIGRRVTAGSTLPMPKDDYRQVADFFERWHAESQHYTDS
jgi:SAM-dependent methyltransferase